MENKQTYNAYIGFRLDIINNLILEAEDKDECFKIRLKEMANKYNINNLKFDKDMLMKLKNNVEDNEKLVLTDYKKNKDTLMKLKSLSEYLKESYENFDVETSFQIPFILNSRGYGTLKKIQLPIADPKLIKDLIDLKPLEERLRESGFNKKRDKIDIVLTCHSTKGIERERIEFIIEKLQSYGEIFIYIGDKLYIAREDATKNEEKYDISGAGREMELAIIRYIYDEIEVLTKDLELIYRYIV